MTAHHFRASALKRNLKLCWTSQRYYALPGGAIRVRTNRIGLAEPVLGRPVSAKAGGGSKKPNAPPVLYLYQDLRKGWLICREGRLVSHASTSAAFEEQLLSEVGSILLERLIGTVVLPGRLVQSEGRKTLTIHVDPDSPSVPSRNRLRHGAETTNPLLVLGSQSADSRIRVPARIDRAFPVQFVSALWQRPDRVILYEGRADDSERVEESIGEYEGMPWVLSSAVSLGTDPGSGLRELQEYMSSCSAFEWSGRPGRASRSLQNLLTTQSLSEDLPPSNETQDIVFPKTIEGLLVRHVAGHCVVIAPGDLRPLFLDSQAEAILRLCDGQTSVGEMVDVAAEVFDIGRAEIEIRLRRFLRALLKEGILKRQDAADRVDLSRVPDRAGQEVGL